MNNLDPRFAEACYNTLPDEGSAERVKRWRARRQLETQDVVSATGHENRHKGGLIRWTVRRRPAQ